MGKLDGTEKVLCVPTELVRQCGEWNGFRGDWTTALALIEHGQFLPRTEKLESDSSWLQVIPYGTVWCVKDGIPKCLVYRRAVAGSEHRLHDLLSLGFGGHVNPEDARNESVVLNAMKRELGEETGLSSLVIERGVRFEFQGMIWCPSWTGVEAVHIGAYFEIFVSEGDMSLRDPENTIDLVGWFSHLDLRDVDRSLFETWSRAVLDGRILRDDQPTGA